MTNNKYKILAIFGKSGSGKDTIKKWLGEKANVKIIIPHTTRPKRDSEMNMVDYYFVAKEAFERNRGYYYTISEFNNWLYGNPLSDLDDIKINVGVFNIQDIKQMLACDKIEVFPLLIKAADNIRLLRCLKREEYPDCSEICRRFLADEKDFNDIDFTYDCYENSFGSKEEFLNIIEYDKKLSDFLKIEE